MFIKDLHAKHTVSKPAKRPVIVRGKNEVLYSIRCAKVGRLREF